MSMEIGVRFDKIIEIECVEISHGLIAPRTLPNMNGASRREAMHPMSWCAAIM
jgi:hypothetical protein